MTEELDWSDFGAWYSDNAWYRWPTPEEKAHLSHMGISTDGTFILADQAVGLGYRSLTPDEIVDGPAMHFEWRSMQGQGLWPKWTSSDDGSGADPRSIYQDMQILAHTFEFRVPLPRASGFKHNEERCSVASCGRIKDRGKACWWCGGK